MLNGNFGLGDIISAIAVFLFGAAFMGFMIWLAFPFSRLRQKIRHAAKTTATVNRFEITKSRHGFRTVPRYRYWGTVEYIFVNEKDEFCDGKITYHMNILSKRLEYGDEFKIIYDKKDSQKSVPVFLLKSELWIKIPVLTIFIALFVIIGYLMFFA